MNKINIISKRELSNMFINPVGYIFAGILLIVCNWMFFSDFFINGIIETKSYWNLMVFFFSLFIPAITMNLISEERKNGTWEILISTPIDEKEIILGKYFGVIKYLLLIFLFSLPTLLTVFFLGKTDIGIIISGALGTLVLAAAYTSVGIFMSTLSNQPIVAFLGSTIILMINNLMGQEVLLSRSPLFLRAILESLSLKFRSAKFGNGLFEISDLVFFISFITIFLILSVLSLKLKEK